MVDARIPVHFGSLDDMRSNDALLIEGTLPRTSYPAAAFGLRGAANGHVPGCRCCQARSTAGAALGQLFSDRATGRVGFFTRVVAVTTTTEGVALVEAALRADPVASSRFRDDRP